MLTGVYKIKHKCPTLHLALLNKCRIGFLKCSCNETLKHLAII